MFKAKHSEKEIELHAGKITLSANLTIPEGAIGIVLFAHGSGSSRHSPRNKLVAKELNEGKIATLLLDLLTAEEESTDLTTREYRFNIKLLAERLASATDWVLQHKETQDLPISYFGSSTGAAAALVAGAMKGNLISAIVSRGGRPDLAGNALPLVVAPTLLIVGGNDSVVVDLNHDAYQMLLCEKKLEIVAGATHLFEEPGSLEEVSELARQWFLRHH